MCVSSDRDEACVSQYPQVSRDARLTHSEVLDELAHRALLGSDGVQNASSGRLHDGLKHCGLDHEARITHGIYTRKQIYGGRG
ncbi:hypothetical protein PACID_26900 [Acidipropionibacterium acidipropionici ATCC 4875]|uniref:Uncharacterized protein n=1 Tax=Acidipropionibacterium acidipropionici (strain ATCC 4875 / DSM 20272 / JCM 6432 / NBRC 12425 / NCIMB 8070 / 4) TaxID=1171373 RepID=K7RVP3_ACIA4|nr:hypothetical protein PACID_26900 [Acidipropionibacterium acidipropionici ATCC 4875]